MTSCGLCVHSGGVWAASPKILPQRPKDSRWNLTFACFGCWKRLGQVYSKGPNLEASPVTALLSKFTANIYLWFWLWSQGSSRDSAAMLLAWSFQDLSFQNLCHNCICKEVILGINSWLADGFTQWSLYQAPGIYRQSRSMLCLAQGSEITSIERLP